MQWSNRPHGIQWARCCWALQDECIMGVWTWGRDWKREREKQGKGGGLVYCLSWWFPDDGRGRQLTSWASLTRLQGSGPSLSAAAWRYIALCTPGPIRVMQLCWWVLDGLSYNCAQISTVLSWNKPRLLKAVTGCKSSPQKCEEAVFVKCFLPAVTTIGVKNGKCHQKTITFIWAYSTKPLRVFLYFSFFQLR